MQMHLQTMARTLEMPVAVEIILPDQISDEPMKSLYLLHDYGGNRMQWNQKTALERYVTGMNLAVIMVDGNNRYFVNPPDGHNYGEYVTKELPVYLEELLPISKKRKDRMIVGGGMGGYGALRAFLAEPENYGEAAAWNPHLGMEKRYEKHLSPDLRYTFGERKAWKNSGNDLFYLAEQHKGQNGSVMGKIRIQWESGWADREEAERLAELCRKNGNDVMASEETVRKDGPVSDVWEFYDQMLCRWLLEKREEWGK